MFAPTESLHDLGGSFENRARLSEAAASVPSFPHAFSGNPGGIRTGPRIKTFGGDDLRYRRPNFILRGNVTSRITRGYKSFPMSSILCPAHRQSALRSVFISNLPRFRSFAAHEPFDLFQRSTTNRESHPSRNRFPPANRDARTFDRQLWRQPGLAQASRPS
jgi:hypothetical protein